MILERLNKLHKIIYVIAFLFVSGNSLAGSNMTDAEIEGIKNSGKSVGGQVIMNNSVQGAPAKAEEIIGSVQATPLGSVNDPRGADSTMTFESEFPCMSGRKKTIGNVEIDILFCGANGADIKFCDQLSYGKVCSDNDWNFISLQNNSPETLSDYEFTVNCFSSPNKCNLKIISKKKIEFSTAEIETKGSQYMGAMENDPNSMYSDTAKLVNSPDYLSTFENIRDTTGKCFIDQTNQLKTSGEMTSCDGGKTILLGNPGECKEVTECLQWDDQSSNYEEKCEIDVPLQIVNCTTEVGTGECENTVNSGDYNCRNELKMDTKICNHSKTVTQEHCDETLEMICDRPPYCNAGGILPKTVQSDIKFVYTPESGILDVGSKTNNIWSGSCRTVDRTTTFEIENVDRLQEFMLTDTWFDDWMQITINGIDVYFGPKVGMTKLEVVQSCTEWEGKPICLYNKVDYGAGIDKCELSTSWHKTPNINILPYLKDGTNTIFMRVIVAGKGEGLMRFRVKQQCYCNWVEKWTNDCDSLESLQ